MKVAIIEDEKSIIEAVNVGFEFRWPEVKLLAAQTGKEGVELVRKERPDIVILDINLPDTSGFNVLKEVRRFSSVPVIILTVRSEESDMLKGLDAGADDYIVKPFNYLNLLARVKAVLRRAEDLPLKSERDTVVSARLKIDFVNQRVTVDGQRVKLTHVEYRLLVLLVKNKNRVISQQQIIKEIWAAEQTEVSPANARIYIRRLRKKLLDSPPRMILTQHGSGYLFNG